MRSFHFLFHFILSSQYYINSFDYLLILFFCIILYFLIDGEDITEKKLKSKKKWDEINFKECSFKPTLISKQRSSQLFYDSKFSKISLLDDSDNINRKIEKNNLNLNVFSLFINDDKNNCNENVDDNVNKNNNENENGNFDHFVSDHNNFDQNEKSLITKPHEKNDKKNGKTSANLSKNNHFSDFSYLSKFDERERKNLNTNEEKLKLKNREREKLECENFKIKKGYYE